MRQGTSIDATLIATPSSTFTRAEPECAGGTRTRKKIGIPRCTRPKRATSGTSGCCRGPRSGRSTSGWIARQASSIRWKRPPPMCMTSHRQLCYRMVRRHWPTWLPGTRELRSGLRCKATASTSVSPCAQESVAHYLIRLRGYWMTSSRRQRLTSRFLSALLSARDAWIEHLDAVYCALLFMGHR